VGPPHPAETSTNRPSTRSTNVSVAPSGS
jgi:hypothetical protein